MAGGGLWFTEQAIEEPAEFLLQHPQIGNVIGAQGHRWLKAESNRLECRWSALVFP